MAAAGWSMAAGLTDYLRSISLRMQLNNTEPPASDSTSFDSGWIEDVWPNLCFWLGPK